MQTAANEWSLKAGEMNCVEKVVDISLTLAKISEIITDHRRLYNTIN